MGAGGVKNSESADVFFLQDGRQSVLEGLAVEGSNDLGFSLQRFNHEEFPTDKKLVPIFTERGENTGFKEEE